MENEMGAKEVSASEGKISEYSRKLWGFAENNL
jgi:hypothetical protein